MNHKRDQRGQAYALEGIIGAIIVVSSLVLGLQAVDIAPWTDSDIEQTDQTRLDVSDTLDAAQDSDALRRAVTCLAFDEVHPGVADADDVTTEFGEVLASTIDDEYNYHIFVDYPTSEGIETTQINPGDQLPNQPTATVSRQLVLSNSDLVYEGENCEIRRDASGDPVTLEDADNLYLEDQDSGSDLFSVVRVRVIAW